MFTGIIECMGEVVAMEKDRDNVIFTIESPISNELKVDQSLAHDGVCLTVTQVEGNRHQVTAILETLRKSTLGNWGQGTLVNLERSMSAGGRFDGHIVQGHVDQTAVCDSVHEEGGSWFFTFTYEGDKDSLTVEKGSVCVNGVSLTVVNSKPAGFSVAIIPYTYQHTNFKSIEKGTTVNLEFDILGKYIQKILAAQTSR